MGSRGGFRAFEGQSKRVPAARRRAWVTSHRLALLALVATGAGCATASYRVPGVEVQRLASVPPAERGDGVRIVPESAPLYPSTERPEPPPPPPGASPVAPVAFPPEYGPPEIVVEEAPPPPVVVTGPDLYVEVDGPVFGPRARVAPPPRVAAGHAPARVVASPARPTWPAVSGRPPSSGGGGWRGSPPVATTRSIAPRPASFAPSSPRPSGRAPTFRSSGGSHHHHGGGGGGNDAAAVVGAAVVVVGLVAILAVASANAAAASHARAFDGWVDVEPTHALRLHYRDNRERIVALSDLRPADTIGVEYGELSETYGPIQPRPVPLAPAVQSARAPVASPAPEALRTPAASPAPVAAAAPVASPASVVAPSPTAPPGTTHPDPASPSPPGPTPGVTP